MDYTIAVEEGLFEKIERIEEIAALKNKRCVIIADHIVANLYGENLKKHLVDCSFQVELFSFLSGEEHKSRKTKEEIENQMLEAGVGRDSFVLALGGGVTLDLAGYIAATYCRGIPLIMIPTSLLAMVDASIGGKVGVNAGRYKNMIGSIYPAKYVLIDPVFLLTLGEEHFLDGIVEMVKHGVIAGESYFHFLKENHKAISSKDPKALSKAIYESCEIKKRVVELDPFEGGLRRILNFGHTIGHAIESISGYRVSHGKAVAMGMVLEGHISFQCGCLSEESLEEIVSILNLYGVDLSMIRNIMEPDLFSIMTLDKKSMKGVPRIVFLEKIGKVQEFSGSYSKEITRLMVERAIRETVDALCCH